VGATLLQLKGIVKEFPGVRALDNVDMCIAKGEIHALVGENGAGKSTLMNVLSGVYPHGSYQGEIIFDGRPCVFLKSRDSEKLGIVIIHQELALVPNITIAENIFLGNELGSAFGIDWDETYDRADEHLKIVGLRQSSRTLVKDIDVGKQQLVEIARALAKNVRLLILDEPTASLNESDSRKLLDLLRQFKEEGTASILISHKLSEVSQVADRITILRDGRTIETLTRGVDDISEGRIIKGMVGREMTSRFPPRASRVGEVALDVRNWTVRHQQHEERNVCENVSFNMRKGEVVGISGLMGAGRTELAMSIFGQSYGQGITGDVYINGRQARLKNVRSAIENRIAYVTEDRKGNGLILNSAVRVNITLANMGKVSANLHIDADMEHAVANEYREKLQVKCPTVEQHAGNLSGGNQQKVLLSKWMFAEPEILILDEPTRGVDVGAKYAIYEIINDLAAEGKSVLFISSEMTELLGMCDRIYVMSEGRMVAELSQDEASQEAIMASILQSGKGA
jgi:putative multiple sugar transport system ATP-binding protein